MTPHSVAGDLRESGSARPASENIDNTDNPDGVDGILP